MRCWILDQERVWILSPNSGRLERGLVARTLGVYPEKLMEDDSPCLPVTLPRRKRGEAFQDSALN